MMTLILLNLANILFVTCYIVRDVFWLRLLAVLGMFTIMPYYFFHLDSPMLGPIIWNVIFILINLFWIVLLFIERRPPRMTEDERRLYALAFSTSCSERNMLRLLARGKWKVAAKDDVLVKRNEPLKELMLIHTGSAAVCIDGKRIAKLVPGDLMGEMSFLTSEATCADVVAEGELGYIHWDHDDLLELFHQRANLRTVMYEVIGRDMVEKLSSSSGKIPALTLSISMPENGMPANGMPASELSN